MAATSRQQNEPSIPELVSSATADVKLLISDQIALTKMEVQASAKTAGKSAALLGVAAFLGVLFFIFTLVTAAYGLVAVGLPEWAGFGIVALLLGIVAAILGVVGKKRMESLGGPEHAKEQLEVTKEVLASSVSNS